MDEKKIVKTFTGFGVFAVVLALGLGLAFPLKWTWNYVMPYLLGLPIITWGQAWCLIFISTLLIKGSTTHTHADLPRDKK